MFTIHRAHLADVERVVPLFDAYRVFNTQESDVEGAKHSLKNVRTRKSP